MQELQKRTNTWAIIAFILMVPFAVNVVLFGSIAMNYVFGLGAVAALLIALTYYVVHELRNRRLL
ncbi:hypothetical protein EML15_04255 [Corynebacterium sp. sy017]|uniref:hypothetical protein n=1 Tax=unclassified Corynebacterium TaxID=2624378 RepID=UPI0011851586|nr:MULTISPECIES: hypothetical protein [unclassified Corynebacterium]MBP3088359.1 hypothetical protein [Corynebacterium sp. sy017]TSD91675.1 hypothetical protein ELY17_04255 [Corynebacterium sp. SY003]